MPSHTPRAFTLIELLVVITIIVVLLALLAPALDSAIYQAELAVCAGNLKAVASSVSLYAMNSKRAYPYRSGLKPENDLINWSPEQLRDPRDGGVHDDRPELAPYMDLNKSLNCPLSEAVDLTHDGSTGKTMILANYEMYWGWGYRRSAVVHPPPAGRPGPGQGMHKLGDRWETDPGNPDGSGRYLSSVIAADLEYAGFFHNQVWSSHPDKSGVMAPMVWQNFGDPGADTGADPAGNFATAAAASWIYGDVISVTWSRWDSRAGDTLTETNKTWARGPLDRHFAHGDGSVLRLSDIILQSWTPDPRMIFTSANADAYNTLHNKHLPKP